MSAALLVAVLIAGGVYLVLQRELLRVVLGFLLLGHGTNVLIISAGGMFRREPALLGQQDRAEMVDPLPQAFVLTAIVIAFAITVYLLALLKVGDSHVDGTDTDTEDEEEDDQNDTDEDDTDEGDIDGDRARRRAEHAADRAAATRPGEVTR